MQSSGRSSPSISDLTTLSPNEVGDFDAANELAVIDAGLEDIVNVNHPDQFTHYERVSGFPADLGEPVNVPKNGALSAQSSPKKFRQ